MTIKKYGTEPGDAETRPEDQTDKTWKKVTQRLINDVTSRRQPEIADDETGSASAPQG